MHIVGDWKEFEQKKWRRLPRYGRRKVCQGRQSGRPASVVGIENLSVGHSRQSLGPLFSHRVRSAQ